MSDGSEMSDVSSEWSQPIMHKRKFQTFDMDRTLSQDYEMIALIFVRYVQACCLPLCGVSRCQRFHRIVNLVRMVLPTLRETFNNLLGSKVADALIEDIEVFLQRAHPECAATSAEATDPFTTETEAKIKQIKEHYHSQSQKNADEALAIKYHRLGAHLVEIIKHFHEIAFQKEETIGEHVHVTGRLLKELLTTEYKVNGVDHACVRFGIFWNTLLVYLHKAYGYSVYVSDFSNSCYLEK